jgi:CTP:molybdopterin cytidylyltransferase MocA
MSPRRVGGVIAAAGHGRRMGGPKALVHVGGRRLVDRVAEAMIAAGLAPVVVVTSTLVRAALDRSPPYLVVEGDPDADMLDSLLRGLGRLPESVDGAVVQPVDAPFTSPELVAALLAGDGHVCRVPCVDARPGHPVYLPRRAFRVLAERPPGGLREALTELELELVDWPDPSILADLDTVADLEDWRAALGARLH